MMVIFGQMKKIFPLELEEDFHRQLKHVAIDARMTLHAWIINALKEQINNDGACSKRKAKSSDQTERPDR
jgi:hypothetical protein